ncbi:hypothetical protein [Leifsonia sp. P73]|uniref:hypothetical protein n=1 Tax=Leifsonia sp. P73 TaxID=3423959 RepID=UPI003DA42FC1
MPATANALDAGTSTDRSEYSVSADPRRATLSESRPIESAELGARSLAGESNSVTDAELVAFLLLAKGPIAERNPAAVAAAESQLPELALITDEQALEASQRYVDASAVFSSRIRPGLLSDNPVSVQRAIDEFGKDFAAYIEANSKEAAQVMEAPMSRDGCNGSVCVAQWALAATTAVVVWQVAGLHTAAAVTIVAAAAVFVYLPGNERMGAMDRQKFVSRFMSGVRA